MRTTDRELLQMGLDALLMADNFCPPYGKAETLVRLVVNEIRARLAEPAQEPQRKPLTDDELQQIAYQFKSSTTLGAGFYAVARAVEAAHGIKGKV